MPADPLATDALEQRLKTGVPLSHAEQMELAEIVGRGPAQDIADKLEAQAKAMRNSKRRPRPSGGRPGEPLPDVSDLPRLVKQALRRIAAARRQDERTTRPTRPGQPVPPGTGSGQPLSRAAERRATRATAQPARQSVRDRRLDRQRDRGIR